MGASSCTFIQKKMGVDDGFINHHVVENTTIKLLGGPLRGKLSNASDFDLSFRNSLEKLLHPIKIINLKSHIL